MSSIKLKYQRNSKEVGTVFQLNPMSNVQKERINKGGRQYAKRKKSGDEKEEPFKKSRHLKEKGATVSTKATEAEKELTEETEPDRELAETSSQEELPDVPWTKS